MFYHYRICEHYCCIYILWPLFQCRINRIGGVMVSVLTSSAVDRGFELRLGHTKDYKIGICCFSLSTQQ